MGASLLCERFPAERSGCYEKEKIASKRSAEVMRLRSVAKNCPEMGIDA